MLPDPPKKSTAENPNDFDFPKTPDPTMLQETLAEVIHDEKANGIEKEFMTR